MKDCFLLLILAILQFFLNLRYGSADKCGELVCNISKGDSADEELCISGKNLTEKFKVGEGKDLITSCFWNMYPGKKRYRLFLTAPEGWVFLLQLNSTRIFVEAKDIEPPGNQSSSLIYNTSGNYNFLVPDHFLSTTKRIRIRLLYPDDQRMYNVTTFSVFVRTVQEIDRWTVNQSQCTIHHKNAWGNNGYDGTNAISNGSLYIMCNKTQPVHEVLITFHYNISGALQIPVDGFIQIIYNNVNPRILIDRRLKMTCDFSNQTSFWIRFNATGEMKLNIYDVIVHSFVYDREDDETIATSITKNVSLPSSSSLDSTPSSPSSATASTANSTSIHTGQATASIPIFLIPTVSVVAMFLLVLLVVLCICLRKRCHKNQSRDRDSAPLDDPASLNNEQHEYCEVRPSVKFPPYKTLSGVTDQSVGQKNCAFVVTGPAMAMAETVHSDEKTTEVKTPEANHKVLSDGPVYTMVDMEKKALDREEKANNARNRGNAYVNNVDKLNFIPLDEYETVTVSPPVSPGTSASLRPDSYPLSEYETVSPPMSPVAMVSELERPYDTLHRGPVQRKQTATSPTASTVVKKAQEEADHDDALNVYNEIATPAVVLKESEEGSEAYQHLQRPLSKRPKAGAPLPVIPDEGYGRLDLGGSGASNQTDPVTDQAQDPQGPKTTQVDPMYAILEEPAEAKYVPDDDDPEYDLLDACV